MMGLFGIVFSFCRTQKLSPKIVANKCSIRTPWKVPEGTQLAIGETCGRLHSEGKQSSKNPKLVQQAHVSSFVGAFNAEKKRNQK